MKLIEVKGIFEITDNDTHDSFLDELLDYCESKGWYFTGGSADVTDEYPEDVERARTDFF